MTETDHGKIVKTVRELLQTYDVTDKHYCINERGNNIGEIWKEIEAKLKELHPELLDQADYYGVNMGERDKTWPTEYGRLAVFYVRGGSEGYYVHVETLDAGHKCWFLAKTLREGEAGISWAEQMVCARSRMMEP